MTTASLPQIFFLAVLALAMIDSARGGERPRPNPWRDMAGFAGLIALLLWGGFFRVWGLG